MNNMDKSSSLRRSLRWVLEPLDPTLLLLYGILAIVSFLLIASVAPERVVAQGVNLVFAVIALWVASRIPLPWLQRLTPFIYLAVLLLLLAVKYVGETSKGAQRWLDVGPTRVQPSELAKIAVPLAMAWYFQKKEEVLSLPYFFLAGLFVLIPAFLVWRQPDLGTTMLILAIGISALFCIGVSWKFFSALGALAIVGIPILWPFLHDFQKARVLVLFDPQRDALGSGFHTIQSTIAVGSGGFFGKGWGNGTQSHLNFLPEHHTDFIFAALAEEFGFLGAMGLIVLFLFLLTRMLAIAGRAPDLFARTLAASFSAAIFISLAINVGMVTGLLPIVGVPLPFISYGGTALLIYSAMLGVLMNISHQQRLIQR